MLDHCSCGHLASEHRIAVGNAGVDVHGCEATNGRGRACGCRIYRAGADSTDLEIDDELPWRAA